MVSASGASVSDSNKAIADLFFSDGGFRFSDDAAAYQHFSQKVSVLVGRPVVVINLGDLPHAYADPLAMPQTDVPAFSRDEIADRAAKIEAICRATFPDAGPAVWDSFKFRQTAGFVGPVADTVHADSAEMSEPKSVLGSRMEGALWNRAAVILVPDRNWSERKNWSFLTGLREEEITNFPRGEALRVLSFFHELGHLLQRFKELLDSKNVQKTEVVEGLVSFAKIEAGDASKVLAYKATKWAYEADADKASVDFAKSLAGDERAPPGLTQSLHEVIGLLAPVRALSRFVMSPEFYGTALAVDAHLKGNEPLSFGSVCKAEDELLWRSLVTLEGIRRSRDGSSMSQDMSDLFQETTQAYREGRLSDLSLLDPISRACDGPKDPSIRSKILGVLIDVVKNDPITNPLTLQAAKLVLHAAHYTNPGLFDVLKLGQRAESEVMRRQKDFVGVTVMPEVAPFIPEQRTQVHAHGIGF